MWLLSPEWCHTVMSARHRYTLFCIINTDLFQIDHPGAVMLADILTANEVL